MKILIVIDGGDPYFMEYEMVLAPMGDVNFAITGMWEYCPGCLAEMGPEVYLATHMVEPDRATEIVARNFAAIFDMVMPL
jgi:hypothetical protein